MEIYDKNELVDKTIGSQIEKLIQGGKSLDEVIHHLNDKIKKFEKTLISLSTDEVRYRLLSTHNKICQKKIVDLERIKYMIENYEEYSNLSVPKLLCLIKLRDKLSNGDFKINP